MTMVFAAELAECKSSAKTAQASIRSSIDERADQGAREAAIAFNGAAEDYVASRHPSEAGRVADFVSITISVMSAKARNGHRLEQLRHSRARGPSAEAGAARVNATSPADALQVID